MPLVLFVINLVTSTFLYACEFMNTHWKWPRLVDDDLPPSSEQNQWAKDTRLKFDLEKLKDPNVLKAFLPMIGGKFTLFTTMNNENADMNSMIAIFNTPVSETASEILGKHR